MAMPSGSNSSVIVQEFLENVAGGDVNSCDINEDLLAIGSRYVNCTTCSMCKTHTLIP